MPSSPSYIRNYKQERLTAERRGETGIGSNSSDAIRHRARRALEKKLGHKLSSRVQVNHKRMLKDSKENANELSNLNVESVHTNESEGGKKGNRAGKARKSLFSLHRRP